jgi:hypothetical protein
MEILDTDLRCSACRSSFTVRISTMRLNFRHACPFCGSVYSISEEEAIRAHRTLDEIERMRKCECCVSGRGTLLDASARLGKCFNVSAFPAIVGNDLCEAV